MRVRRTRRLLAVTSVAALAAAVAPLTAGQVAAAAPAGAPMHINCATGAVICTEVHDSETVFGEDVYVAHDEPATLFYDDHQSAGNNNTYLLRLPKDPPKLPNQAGTGGTFNFQ